MNIDEKSKDNNIEDIAETFAEVVNEDSLEKPKSEDVEQMEEELRSTIEEVVEPTVEPVMEPVMEPVEEATDEVVEQQAAETVEEPVSEPTDGDIPETPVEKKSRKGLYITLASIAAGLLLLLGGFYYGTARHYADKFFVRTTVNGIECAGKTVDEVNDILQAQVEEYVLTIVKSDGTTEQIKGTDIGIKYSGRKQLEEAFESQDKYKWPKAMFEDTEIEVQLDYEYDSAKLEEKINALECLNPEKQVAAVSATVVYVDGQYVIQEEVPGTQIDSAKLTEIINVAVTSFDTEVNIKDEGCYLPPVYTKESEEIIAVRDELNKYLSASITYSLDGIVVTLNKEQISQWVSLGENLTPQISEEGVRAFASTLSGKYNTANRSGQLTTPRGKVVTMPLGGYGRTVGVDAEVQQLLAEIKEGKTVTREPILSRKATPAGQNIWGNTYVEVDISAQHLWYVVNGAVVLETDVITGKAGVTDTPTGHFTVIEKIKGKYLRGRLVNGKPSYVVWVDYWMRLTWSGIGLHDCTWHQVFGGEIYKTSGSHGCINIPPAYAAELYRLISVGTNVLIHY